MTRILSLSAPYFVAGCLLIINARVQPTHVSAIPSTLFTTASQARCAPRLWPPWPLTPGSSCCAPRTPRLLSSNEVAPDPHAASYLDARFAPALRFAVFRCADCLLNDPISRCDRHALRFHRRRVRGRRFFLVQISTNAGSTGSRTDSIGAERTLPNYSESDVSRITTHLYRMLIRNRIALVPHSANCLFRANKLSADPVRRTAPPRAFWGGIRCLPQTSPPLVVNSLRRSSGERPTSAAGLTLQSRPRDGALSEMRQATAKANEDWRERFHQIHTEKGLVKAIQYLRNRGIEPSEIRLFLEQEKAAGRIPKLPEP